MNVRDLIRAVRDRGSEAQLKVPPASTAPRPPVRRGIYLLPALFTIGNMAFGFFSLVKSVSYEFGAAATAILLGHVLDILDGTVARLTKTTSRFGVELDSLADWLTFSIAPSFLMYQLVLKDNKSWGFAIALLFAILVAFGLLLLTGAVRIAFAALVISGSLLGIGREVTTSRSQSEVAAAAISRTVDPESNPLVVSCPDQLAVSLERATGGAYETVVFPDLGRDPRFVDWVDYAERNADADAAEFVTALNKRAEGRPIVLAVNLTYKTLETKCAQVAALLQSSRPAETLIEGDGESYYESMSILYFPQP